jgi:spoIIIJ-associated protein
LLIVKGENLMTGSAPELATLVDGSDPDVGEPDRDRTAELEQEGEIAADYLEALLDIVDMDGDLDLDVEGERAVVAIVGDSLDKLIGTGGETLEALQELTRLAVLQKTGNRSRLMLDVGGHRSRRRTELRKIAAAAAERVAGGSGPEKLVPMTPFERKVVHDVIAEIDGVHSESEGEEPRRSVVLFPGDAP